MKTNNNHMKPRPKWWSLLVCVDYRREQKNPHRIASERRKTDLKHPSKTSMFPLHKWPKKHAQNLPLNIENAWKMRVIVVVLLLTTVLATRRTHTHHGNNQRNFRNAFWKNNKMEVYLKVTQWGGTTNSSTIIEILSKSPNYLFELYKQSQNIR